MLLPPIHSLSAPLAAASRPPRHQAILEETDVRIAELKKDAYEFKRDIVVGAENFRTGKTMAEKVIRYMEEKLRQKDSVVEKLRLKNASLKSQIQKVDLQLRQKEEMGDVLHYIDFHQLGIENKQYMAKIEERNQELLKLKMTTGNTVQVLNNLKRKLNDLIDDSELLKREIKAHTDGPSGLIKIKEVRTRRGVNHRHYRAIIAMPHSPTPFASPTHPTPPHPTHTYIAPKLTLTQCVILRLESVHLFTGQRESAAGD